MAGGVSPHLAPLLAAELTVLYRLFNASLSGSLTEH